MDGKRQGAGLAVAAGCGTAARGNQAGKAESKTPKRQKARGACGDADTCGNSDAGRDGDAGACA